MSIKITRGNNAVGTSLQGYVQTTYMDLVAAFGEPDEAGDKTTASWVLELCDEENDDERIVVTIYDWKESETPYLMYDWHIGGNNHRAVEALKRVFSKGFKYTTLRL